MAVNRNFKFTLFIEVLPIVVLYLLTFGYLSSYFYYRLFSINITSFIGFEDILPQLFETLIILIFVFITFYLSQGTFSERLSKYYFRATYRHRIIFLVSLGGFYLIMLHWGFRGNPHLAELENWLFFVYIVLFLGIVIFLVRKQSYLLLYRIKRGNQALFFNLGVLLFFILLAAPVKSVINYLFINASPYSNGYSIITSEDKQISSSNGYYYIGQNSRYIFYYDVKLKQTDVYPMANVKLIKTGIRLQAANSWFGPQGNTNPFIWYLFWVLFVVLVLALFQRVLL